ncbi:unnamed protein product [Rhizoctonia solani]|uniref:Uncharacterized protein n=1 Tax=Rhizoctonia solani TaxID=456999 RepID=A0A8H3GMJ7_9AGAM|nr:unnamed protein product [Rhizoctonia solani]
MGLLDAGHFALLREIGHICGKYRVDSAHLAIGARHLDTPLLASLGQWCKHVFDAAVEKFMPEFALTVRIRLTVQFHYWRLGMLPIVAYTG